VSPAAGLAGELGRRAPDFALPDPDGRVWSLAEIAGRRGTLVMFICNHCPYVKGTIADIVADAKALAAEGVGTVAIMPNDVAAYPADAPPQMKRFAAEHGMPFPYLYDESQAVAAAYGAVCTPDFFGFDKDLALRYRGRLMAVNRTVPVPGARRELLDAMRAIAATGQAPADQTPSMGCSIKWRRAG
jgi:peroxiredoxin